MAEKSDVEILKKNYELARNRYALPNFEELDAEFDIRKADKNGAILKECLIQICATLTEYCNFFDPALDPNPSTLHSFIEMGAFRKKEKNELLCLYKQIGHLVHKIYLADLGSDKDKAEYIKLALKEWLSLKPEVKKFVKKLADEWAKGEQESKVVNEYLG